MPPEEPVTYLDETEEANDLDHGDGTHAGDDAQRQPSHPSALVVARPEQGPRQQAAGEDGYEQQHEQHRLTGGSEVDERRHLQRRHGGQRPRLGGGTVGGDGEHDSGRHPGGDGERTDPTGQLGSQERGDRADGGDHGDDVEGGAGRTEQSAVARGVGDVHQLTDDGRQRHSGSHRQQAARASATARMPPGGDRGGDDGHEGDEHPQPGARRPVRPRVDAGRAADLSGKRRSSDHRRHRDDGQRAFGDRGSCHENNHPRPCRCGPPCWPPSRWRFSTITVTDVVS